MESELFLEWTDYRMWVRSPEAMGAWYTEWVFDEGIDASVGVGGVHTSWQSVGGVQEWVWTRQELGAYAHEVGADPGTDLKARPTAHYIVQG